MESPPKDYRPTPPDPDVRLILGALLDAPGRHVSGTLIAARLGISRPAVWGKLKKLREQGFAVEAIRNRGYRLRKEPASLCPDLVRLRLEARSLPPDLLYFPILDSTNNEADRQLSRGRTPPFAVAAEVQTKGRGRLGRTWHSPSGDNLYLSVAFQPEQPDRRLRHFTLWAGIHLCRTLQTLAPGAEFRIKWPNDLLCGGRKIAGMLTEAKSDLDGLRHLVFGLGLNINSNPLEYPGEIRNRATSLHAVTGQEFSLNDCLVSALEAIHATYAAATADRRHTEDLGEAWTPLDALAGQTVHATRPGQTLTGVASGIDENGALLLQTHDGRLHPVVSGDVTLRRPDKP